MRCIALVLLAALSACDGGRLPPDAAERTTTVSPADGSDPTSAAALNRHFNQYAREDTR